MKYTRSNDGQMRVTLRASLRATKEDVAEFRRRAKDEGRTLSEWLHDMLMDGIHADSARRHDDEDLDQIYGREDDSE